MSGRQAAEAGIGPGTAGQDLARTGCTAVGGNDRGRELHVADGRPGALADAVHCYPAYGEVIGHLARELASGTPN